MFKLKERRIIKTKEVLQLLRISRATLTKYVKNDLIKVTVLPNGRYDTMKKVFIKISTKVCFVKLVFMQEFQLQSKKKI